MKRNIIYVSNIKGPISEGLSSRSNHCDWLYFINYLLSMNLKVNDETMHSIDKNN